MTHLYLIRHAEAQSAVDRTVGDNRLSRFGVIQAERLRDRLAAGEIKADVLIASTMLRARQTAEIIAPALGLPILFDDDVQEMRPGEAEGMPVEEFRKKYGEPDFERDPFRPASPGGENWGEFMLRMGSSLHRITEQYEGKTIVIVCHGGIIDGSFLYFFGLSTLKVPSVHFYTHNTSITHWQKGMFGGKLPSWRLVKYNDDAHLRDISSPVRIPWKEIAAKPRVGADAPTVPIQSEERQ